MKPSVYSNYVWVEVHNACGGLSFLFACLPKGSGSTTKKNQKRHLPILSGQAAIEYSPMVGSSYVELGYMAVKCIGSLMWCRDRRLFFGCM